VVQEAVQEADGGGVLGQEPAPLVEGPVRGDPERSALVGGRDDAEQQLGAGVVERGEADLVDDDEVVAEQGVDDAADGVVGQAAVEGLGEVGGGAVLSSAVRPVAVLSRGTHLPVHHRGPCLAGRSLRPALGALGQRAARQFMPRSAAAKPACASHDGRAVSWAHARRLA
jgi:hypothetical protein